MSLDVSGWCRTSGNSSNTPSKREEGILNTLVCLGTSLEEAQPKLVGKRAPLLKGDGALLVPIALVANKDLVDTGRRVLLDLGVPGADVWGRFSDMSSYVQLTVEGLLVGDVVHDQDAHGSTVVRGGDGAEALLSCGRLVNDRHDRSGDLPAVSHC